VPRVVKQRDDLVQIVYRGRRGEIGSLQCIVWSTDSGVVPAYLCCGVSFFELGCIRTASC
jgi:hypothetical protein